MNEMNEPQPRDIVAAFLELFQTGSLSRPLPNLDGLTIDQAYETQRLVIEERTARGEQLIGYKVGCTSAAIRKQFGLSEPICGRLMSPHHYVGPTRLSADHFCQPAFEPEFVITIGKDAVNEVGENDDLRDLVDCVSPGLELHHFKFWQQPPTMQELIASNGIHAAVIVGENRVLPDKLDWDLEGVGLFKNGALSCSGIGAEIMGGPLRSLRWLINHLVRRGESLRAGQLVIPGSPVELVSAVAGDTVDARFTRLGSIQVVLQ